MSTQPEPVDILAKYRGLPRPIYISRDGDAMWRAIAWHMAAKAEGAGTEAVLMVAASLMCRVAVLEKRQVLGMFGI